MIAERPDVQVLQAADADDFYTALPCIQCEQETLGLYAGMSVCDKCAVLIDDYR